MKIKLGKPNGASSNGRSHGKRVKADGVSPAGPRSVAMDLDEVHPPGAVMEAAASCVRFVLAQLKIELDFERDTLALLDHYVAEARAAVNKRPETLALTAHAVGAYLGEVTRRLHACWWRIDHADPGAWRLEFRNVYLAFYPVQVAYASLRADPDADGFSGFELEAEARAALLARLAKLPAVSEQEYHAPSTSLEVLDIAIDAILTQRAQNPEGARPFEPRDYFRGGKAPS